MSNDAAPGNNSALQKPADPLFWLEKERCRAAFICAERPFHRTRKIPTTPPRRLEIVPCVRLAFSQELFVSEESRSTRPSFFSPKEVRQLVDHALAIGGQDVPGSEGRQYSLDPPSPGLKERLKRFPQIFYSPPLYMLIRISFPREFGGHLIPCRV